MAKIKRILVQLFDAIFGYDFFISYPWADGAGYARDLHRKLAAQGFTVFLDEQDFARGDNWTLLGRRAVKKTRQLILVGTPKVHESAAVLDEVETFSKTGRRIIPIEFGDSLNPLRYTESRLLAYVPGTLLKIKELLQQDTIPGEASVETVRELRKGFHHVRQSQKRIRILVGVSMVLLALSAVAIWAAVIARKQTGNARNQEQRARAQEKIARNEAQRAHEQEQVAKEEKENVRKTFALSDFYRADELVADDKRQAALAYLARAIRSDPSNLAVAKRTLFLLRQNPWFAAQASCFPRETKVYDAKFTANRLLFLAGNNDGIAVFSDKCEALFKPLSLSFESAQFSEDGTTFKASQSDASTYYDSNTGERRSAPLSPALPKVSAEVSKALATATLVAVSANGRVAFTKESQTVSIVAADGKTVDDEQLDFPVLVLRFSADSRRLLAAGGIGTEYGRTGGVAFFSVESGDKQIGMELASEVVAAGFHPDGVLAVTVCQDGSSQLWDSRTGHQLATLSRDAANAAFDPRDGAIIVGATAWRSVGSRPKGRVFGEDIADFTFGSNAFELVTLSKDGALSVWDLRNGALLSRKPGVTGAKQSNDGLPALLSDDGKGALIVLESQTALYVSRDLPEPFSRPFEGRMLARHVASAECFAVIKPEDGLARVINLVSGETSDLPQSDRLEKAEFDLAGSKLFGLCPQQDGRKVLKVWNTRPPSLVGEFPVPAETHRVVAGRGDKFALVTQNEVQIWDLAMLKPIGEPIRHPNYVGYVRFDEAGQHLITTTSPPDSSARIWNAATGTPIIDAISLTEDSNQAWFAPEATSFITSSCSGGTGVGTIQIWDTATGRCLSEPIDRYQMLDDAGRAEPHLEGFGVGTAKMSLDGSRLGIEFFDEGSGVSLCYVVDLPNGSQPVPAWTADLAEAIGGMRLSETGVPTLSEPADRNATLRSVKAKIDLEKDKDPWASAAAWMVPP